MCVIRHFVWLTYIQVHTMQAWCIKPWRDGQHMYLATFCPLDHHDCPVKVHWSVLLSAVVYPGQLTLQPSSFLALQSPFTAHGHAPPHTILASLARELQLPLPLLSKFWLTGFATGLEWPVENNVTAKDQVGPPSTAVAMFRHDNWPICQSWQQIRNAIVCEVD